MLDPVARLAAVESERNVSEFIHALEIGALDLGSPAGAIQSCLVCSQDRLRLYRDALNSGLAVKELIIALRSAVATVAAISATVPQVEVAWTYPGKSRLGLRTTAGVAKEIVDGSRTTLLVVGYSVGESAAETALASQAMAAIANAARRGVAVTIVLHRGANRHALLRWWHKGARPAQIFTWPEADDVRASVHAKLLIADRRDGLITSANLTYHGFEKNLEMGVRIIGTASAQIHDRVLELIADRELVPWGNYGY